MSQEEKTCLKNGAEKKCETKEQRSEGGKGERSGTTPPRPLLSVIQFCVTFTMPAFEDFLVCPLPSYLPLLDLLVSSVLGPKGFKTDFYPKP